MLKKMMSFISLTIFFRTRTDRLKNMPIFHAHLSKYQVKFKTKAWITTTIQKPILVKHSFLKKYIKLNDYAKKMETHDKHKYYRNLLSHVIQKVKKYLLH